MCVCVCVSVYVLVCVHVCMSVGFSLYVSIILHVPKYVCMSICSVLPLITARVFISFQQFLPRLLNETDDYYLKKHVLFIICDASNEF